MSFNKIKGQTLAVSRLKGILENDRVPASLLFTGLEGIGKALTAKAFAKALNCASVEADACGRCSSCLRIEENNYPDLFCVEPGKEGGAIKIDTVRRLKKWLSFKPYESVWRVAIIRRAHLLTHEASNALLKTLEEPPENALFILTAIDAARLLPTIVSRCQTVNFVPLDPGVAFDILVSDYGMKDEDARFVSALAGGSLREAARWSGLKILEEKNRIIDLFLKAVSTDYIDDAEMDLSKEELSRRLDLYESWYRDILITKLSGEKSGLINQDREKEIVLAGKGLSIENIIGSLKAIDRARRFMEQNANRKIAVACMFSDLRESVF